jgi:hypothetical protein
VTEKWRGRNYRYWYCGDFRYRVIHPVINRAKVESSTGDAGDPP